MGYVWLPPRCLLHLRIHKTRLIDLIASIFVVLEDFALENRVAHPASFVYMDMA